MEANYAQNKNDRTSKWQKLMKKKRESTSQKKISLKKINIMVKLGKNGDDQEKKVCRKR